MGTKPTLLIDGDILLFKFAFRHQTKINWGDGIESVSVDEEAAKYDVDVFIDKLVKKTGCGKHIVCFTSKLNFRYKVLPTYKHNRVNSEPPIMLKVIKDHLRATHTWRDCDWLEADDLMGIMGTKQPDEYVLATIDKDFLCLPCTLFNWDKMTFPARISEQEADFWFHYQWLIGDSTDGYTGIKGVGDKGARKILNSNTKMNGQTTEEMTEAVLEAYMQRCIPYEQCLQQARMARILRHTDWDWEKNEVILWEPTY